MKLSQTLCVASLLAAQALMLATSAALHSPVIDEPAHLAAGVSHWELNRFDLFKVNPPLVRMLAALPAMAAGAKTDWSGYSAGVGVRSEFTVMHGFVGANGQGVIWLVTLARWALIPLALLGGYICYRWARELYGDAAGMTALMLWCFCPNVLAYAQILTADAGAAALGVAAGYCFWKWLRDPAWDRALMAGIVLGLAELTKTTWVVLFGLWPTLWVVWKASQKSKVQGPKSAEGSGSHTQRVPGVQGSAGSQKSHDFGYKQKPHGFFSELAQLVMLLGLALLCLNAGYDFEGSGTRLRNYLFLSRPLKSANDIERARQFGNRFARSWFGKMPVPLPKNYLEGIDLQWHDIELGKPSYLRGQWQERGWWYWYLYALAVKVPLGTWGLLLLAAVVRVGHRRHHAPRDAKHHAERDVYGGGVPITRTVTWRDELVLLAPAIAVLILVSSQTGFSRYIRYVLPMFPFVFIWISSIGRFVEVRQVMAALRRLREIGVSVRRQTKGGSAAIQSGDESPHSMAKGGDESPHSRALSTLTILLLAWSVGSSLWYAPHSMSYFNELAGGPMGGPRHLVDAQVDWGQDLLYLKKWLDSHPEARPLGVVYFGPISPSVAGIDFYLPPKGTVASNDRIEIAGVPKELKPGWYAVSVNYLYGYDHYIYDPSGSREWVTRPYYSYFRRCQPVATAGYSIYIYHLTANRP